MLKSADQLLTTHKPARSDIRYWQGVVFQRDRKRDGTRERAKHFSVQLRVGGRREEFNLARRNRMGSEGEIRKHGILMLLVL